MRLHAAISEGSITTKQLLEDISKMITDLEPAKATPQRMRVFKQFHSIEDHEKTLWVGVTREWPTMREAEYERHNGFPSTAALYREFLHEYPGWTQVNLSREEEEEPDVMEREWPDGPTQWYCGSDLPMDEKYTFCYEFNTDAPLAHVRPTAPLCVPSALK